jgi:competence protein ComEC
MKKYGKFFVGVCTFLIIGICLITQLPHGEFLVSFLDVGQGDAIFVRTSDDYIVLVDGGPGPMVLDEIAKVMPIYTRTIDLVVLTHPHADHVNGLVEITKRYDVKQILIVGTPSHNAFYQELLRIVEMKKIEVIFANSQNDFRIGNEVFLDILWPVENQAGVAYENVNNASVAMRIIWGNRNGVKNVKFLLTGDAEIEEEHEILEAEFDISADILKAGHHGSRTASSEAFLQEVEPEVMVIQSGEENSFGHPHKETLAKSVARDIQVRRNDFEGKVDFIFSQYQLPNF